MKFESRVLSIAWHLVNTQKMLSLSSIITNITILESLWACQCHKLTFRGKTSVWDRICSSHHKSITRLKLLISVKSLHSSPSSSLQIVGPLGVLSSGYSSLSLFQEFEKIMSRAFSHTLYNSPKNLSFWDGDRGGNITWWDLAHKMKLHVQSYLNCFVSFWPMTILLICFLW